MRFGGSGGGQNRGSTGREHCSKEYSKFESQEPGSGSGKTLDLCEAISRIAETEGVPDRREVVATFLAGHWIGSSLHNGPSLWPVGARPSNFTTLRQGQTFKFHDASSGPGLQISRCLVRGQAFDEAVLGPGRDPEIAETKAYCLLLRDAFIASA